MNVASITVGLRVAVHRHGAIAHRNCFVLCAECEAAKDDMTPDEWLMVRNAIRLLPSRVQANVYRKLREDPR